MPAAEEAAVGRQWRGMRRPQHAMTLGIDQAALALGRAAPQQEDQPLALAVEAVDDCIGEALPALAMVRAGLAALDGQYRVQQKHALARPRQQATVIRARNAEVVIQL